MPSPNPWQWAGVMFGLLAVWIAQLGLSVGRVELSGHPDGEDPKVASACYMTLVQPPVGVRTAVLDRVGSARRERHLVPTPYETALRLCTNGTSATAEIEPGRELAAAIFGSHAEAGETNRPSPKPLEPVRRRTRPRARPDTSS